MIIVVVLQVAIRVNLKVVRAGIIQLVPVATTPEILQTIQEDILFINGKYVVHTNAILIVVIVVKGHVIVGQVVTGNSMMQDAPLLLMSVVHVAQIEMIGFGQFAEFTIVDVGITNM